VAIEIVTKRCHGCETDKPLSEFYAGYSRCKVCHRGYVRRKYHEQCAADPTLRARLAAASNARYHARKAAATEAGA
jgi:hypothetical protein